jgi:hypothetical protein
MADVLTIKELREKVSLLQQRISAQVIALSAAGRNERVLIGMGLSSSAIDTAIQAQLDEIEDVLDLVATDLAALNYEYAKSVQINEEQDYTHAIIDYNNANLLGHIRASNTSIRSIVQFDDLDDDANPVLVWASGDADCGLSAVGGEKVRLYGVSRETDLNGFWSVGTPSGQTFLLTESANHGYDDPAAAMTVDGVTKGSGDPIKVSINAAHNLTTGHRVTIASVGGATEANGTWTITVVDSDDFYLDGTEDLTLTEYTSGGTATPVLLGWYYRIGLPFSVFAAGDLVRISGASDPDNNVIREVASVNNGGESLTFTTDLPAEDTADNTGLTLWLVAR